MLEVKFLPSHSSLTVSVSVLQEPLKGSLSGAVRTVLRSYTDVCDAVFVVEIGLRFLGKTGGDPQGQLLSYLTDSLQMDPQISSSVAKVKPPNPQPFPLQRCYAINVIMLISFGKQCGYNTPFYQPLWK